MIGRTRVNLVRTVDKVVRRILDLARPPPRRLLGSTDGVGNTISWNITNKNINNKMCRPDLRHFVPWRYTHVNDMGTRSSSHNNKINLYIIILTSVIRAIRV